MKFRKSREELKLFDYEKKDIGDVIWNFLIYLRQNNNSKNIVRILPLVEEMVIETQDALLMEDFAFLVEGVNIKKLSKDVISLTHKMISNESKGIEDEFGYDIEDYAEANYRMSAIPGADIKGHGEAIFACYDGDPGLDLVFNFLVAPSVDFDYTPYFKYFSEYGEPVTLEELRECEFETYHGTTVEELNARKEKIINAYEEYLKEKSHQKKLGVK